MGKWKRAKSLTRRWQRNHLVNKHGAICGICKEPFESMKDITIDHIEPLAKGGADTPDNYQLAHYECNQLKGSLSLEEFEQFQEGKIKYE
jgi:5-methylcytosine-specific restriction endonuclease McrA